MLANGADGYSRGSGRVQVLTGRTEQEIASHFRELHHALERRETLLLREVNERRVLACGSAEWIEAQQAFLATLDARINRTQAHAQELAQVIARQHSVTWFLRTIDRN